MKRIGFYYAGKFNKTILENVKELHDYKIYYNDKTIDHINERHYKKLEALGLSAELFIKFVLQNYNEIWHKKDNEYFLVIKSNIANVALIRLKVIADVGNIYLIETAHPKRADGFKKNTLLWREDSAQSQFSCLHPKYPLPLPKKMQFRSGRVDTQQRVSDGKSTK